MKTSRFITSCYLRSQGIELLCWSSGHGSGGLQLSLANGMHDFDPSDRTARRPERLEAQQRPSLAFHRAMVLFHDIVEILALPEGDGRLVSLVVPLDRGRVRATLIDGDLLREPLGTNGLT
jgi:hypothetical protein